MKSKRKRSVRKQPMLKLGRGALVMIPMQHCVGMVIAIPKRTTGIELQMVGDQLVVRTVRVCE